MHRTHYKFYTKKHELIYNQMSSSFEANVLKISPRDEDSCNIEDSQDVKLVSVTRIINRPKGPDFQGLMYFCLVSHFI